MRFCVIIRINPGLDRVETTPEGLSVDVRVTGNFMFPLWLLGMFWTFSNKHALLLKLGFFKKEQERTVLWCP